MNAGPPAVAPGARVAVRARRCVRHPEREAAAQCAGCGGSFCRECVSEHAERLLCAGCLARELAAVRRARRDYGAVRRAASLAAGLLALWLAFLGAGAWLAALPRSWHDGSVWSDGGGEP